MGRGKTDCLSLEDLTSVPSANTYWMGFVGRPDGGATAELSVEFGASAAPAVSALRGTTLGEEAEGDVGSPAPGGADARRCALLLGPADCALAPEGESRL